MESKQRALLSPLLYSDIFSFPLTLPEICRFTPGTQKVTEHDAKRILATLYPYVGEHQGYYALRGRQQLIKKRVRSLPILRHKYALLMPIVRILSRIPTVYFIGLSGSVAAGSATPSSDIDLFIITKKNTLFTTRFMLLVLLQLVGKRRKRHERTAKDTICLNMFMDEEALAFPQDKHDLYTAREITQLVPLYDKKKTYRRFLKKNSWVSGVFPNAAAFTPKLTAKNHSGTGILELLLSVSFVENGMRWLQLNYMQSSRTTEIITARVLAFHPNDHRLKTLKLYQSKMTTLEANLCKKKQKTVIQLPVIDKEKNIFYTA